MSIVVKETGNGGNYTPLEAGTYPARCVGIIDLGIQHNDFTNTDAEKVRIVWELPTERVEVDGEDKPRWMSKAYTASLHEKANLRKDLDAWRGKPFTEEELAGFDLANIINAPCMLTITHKEKKAGGMTAIVSSVGRIMKGITVAELENDPFEFDMNGEYCENVLNKLPQWMQDEVKRSVTWTARNTPVMEETEEDGGETPF